MTGTRSRGRHNASGKKGLQDAGGELVEMIVAYAKQETLEPLKGLGRYITFGLAGSVAVATGSVLVLVAVLRALQTETGTVFGGHLVWLPYIITTPVALGVIGLLVAVVARGSRRPVAARSSRAPAVGDAGRTRPGSAAAKSDQDAAGGGGTP